MTPRGLESRSFSALSAYHSNLKTLPTRIEQAVAILAPPSGVSVAGAIADFRHWYRSLQPSDSAMTGPLLVDLVAGYAGQRLVGFRYLSTGPSLATLPKSLGATLGATLECCLRGNLGPGAAEQAVKAFQAAFGDLTKLQAFSPHATAMITAGGWSRGRRAVKVYFNTRLAPTQNHRKRVAAIAKAAGVATAAAQNASEHLKRVGANYPSVGFDLGSSRPRLKVYGRLPALHLVQGFENVGKALGIEADARTLTEFIRTMGQAVGPECELGVVVGRNSVEGLRVTCFLNDDVPTGPQRTLRWMKRRHTCIDACEYVLNALETTKAAAVLPCALYGLGLEFPEARDPRLNVYLRGPL